MALNKLSEQLMDAYMTNNTGRIQKIQEEIQRMAQEGKPKPKPNIMKIDTVLNKDDASAISVYKFLNKSIGDDWWELEMETIEKLLWINYGVALEDINRDKVWAIRHVCNSDGPFADWFEFNQVALSFAGAMADFEQLRGISPGMCINAVKTLNHIRPDRESEFSNDVLKYICLTFINNSLYVPPPSIAMLIHDKMGKMVSSQMKEKWIDIIKRYQDIVAKKINDVQETIVDIQAKRLLKAEAAALQYGSR